MNPNFIKKDLETFESSVKKLSSDIKKASVLWNDNKFAELFNSISTIATLSRNVIITGRHCCESIDKFSKLVEEQ